MSNVKEMGKLLNIYYGKKDSPFIANWIITAQCNCKCPFCELGIKNMYKPEEEVSTERALVLIKEMKDMGIKYLTLSGGEVFLRKDIYLIIEKLKEAGIKVGIVTNGLLLPVLSDDKMEVLLKNLDSLIISLDSSVAEEHNHCRRTPKLYEMIMKGIEKFQSKGFDNISFESIIMGQNYKQIPEIVKLAKEKGIRKVMFRPINIESNFPQLGAVGDKSEFADYDVDSIIEYIDKGIAVASDLDVDCDLEFNRKWIVEYFKNLKLKKGFFHDRVMKNYFCFIPFSYVIINYDGGLLPCLLLKPKGNVRDGCLRDERKKANCVRRKLAKRDFYPICNCCFDQANNNVRFSTLCSPFRNLSSLQGLYKDVMSVKKRLNS
ncbi:radical SAM protein [archaeon]|jgi:Fe-coproporphyrin III synthase|nr:radical SAM protein [archaeon]MBT4416970.1 radical SAM protein [archaeon]